MIDSERASGAIRAPVRLCRLARVRTFAHTFAVDDGPFERTNRGDVPIVGVAFSGLRLEGVVSSAVRRDGANATTRVAELLASSVWAAQTRLLMLQGIALAGFNVVDLDALHERLGIPVLVVARRMPDLVAIERALRTNVRGGARKWRLIERAGRMEAVAGLVVQRRGLTLAEAASAIERLAVNGRIPEPLRVAHLVAGGLVRGYSRGRA